MSTSRKRTRDDDGGQKKQQQQQREEEEEDDYLLLLEKGQGERWTHFGGDDTRSISSTSSFAAVYEYPLSRYLEPALLDNESELRMVMYRVNASCVVAPFLEFALTNNGDWPSVEIQQDDMQQQEQDMEQQDDDDFDVVEGGGGDGPALTAATNAAYVLSGAAAENGHFPPRFCGASFTDEGDRQYAWFQVDPSATADPSLDWVTVHELVRVHALRGAALVAETTSFKPSVWHLLDSRGEPVETPMVLEPLTFLSSSSDSDDAGKNKSARTDGEDEADWVQRMLDREADPANYSPRSEPEHSDHRLVGRTMFSFHDPNWPAFLASGGATTTTTTTTTAAESTVERRRYAVFLEDTLYLVGDCARENAALLDFADSHGLFGSVYLRCAASTAKTATAFIWLIQSTDQFAPLG